MDPTRPSAHKVGPPESVPGVTHAHAREAETLDGRDETRTAGVAWDTRRNVDLRLLSVTDSFDQSHTWIHTFSVNVMLATSALALANASPHEPIPVMFAAQNACQHRS